ncbi:MAG: SOS response-associated peptidase [Pirellulaceae bacterium]|nr:SOS response-associated peptidase [Pirellulaceae bacterium]
MCGRFTLRTPLNLVVERFQLQTDVQLPLRFNVAPTQDVAAVRYGSATEPRRLALLRWGLIPSWAKDPAIGNRMINARSETLTERPAFRVAYQRRRCLVLADGYYEWKKQGKLKQPYWIRLADERPFGMAGLWESWADDDQRPVLSCTVLTTSANELTRELHDRMPVILPESDWDVWLDPEVRQTDRLQPLLVPYDSADMRFDPVSTFVNSPRNDDPRCIEVE